MIIVFLGLIIPFLGTTLGAACVFFMKQEMNDNIKRALMGFAAGVMIAAAVWSLLIPAINMSSHLNRFAFFPALIGFFLGVFFLFLLDTVIPHLHINADIPEGPKTGLSRSLMLTISVTLHNIPEGMAVGVVFAGMLNDGVNISIATAFALSLGIALQNFPEGAIVSLSLRTEGNSRTRSFLYGMSSGLVEPIAGLITILLFSIIFVALPYFLALAAGAMIYVVIEELIPEATRDDKTDICTIGFAFGFALMMVLDVALG